MVLGAGPCPGSEIQGYKTLCILIDFRIQIYSLYFKGSQIKISKYSKPFVKWPLSKRPKLVFKTNYHLMQGRSILQYVPPSLNYKDLFTSIFKWSFYIGFTVLDMYFCPLRMYYSK